MGNSLPPAKEIENTHRIHVARQMAREKADAVRKGLRPWPGMKILIDPGRRSQRCARGARAILTRLLPRAKASFINGSRLVYPMEKQAMRFQCSR